MSSSGRIEGLGMVEFLQALMLAKRTVRVDFAENAVSDGVLVLERGRIVHAATANVRGEEAFYAIGERASSDFAVSDNDIPAERTIDISNDFLILELIRRLDERGRF